MKLLIYYKRGAKLILDFKSEQYALDYINAQQRNIIKYEVINKCQ